MKTLIKVENLFNVFSLEVTKVEGVYYVETNGFLYSPGNIQDALDITADVFNHNYDFIEENGFTETDLNNQLYATRLAIMEL